MILKGSQRANGMDLATHLMNAYDNECVEIAELDTRKNPVVGAALRAAGAGIGTD